MGVSISFVRSTSESTDLYKRGVSMKGVMFFKWQVISISISFFYDHLEV